MIRPRLELALVHYPVLNRRGESIGSAITNLDLHDIARAARTFGAHRYWVITPFAEQQDMAREIIGHWRQGHGAEANPDRGEALSLVQVCGKLQEAVSGMNATLQGQRATVVATCARSVREALPYRTMRMRLWQGEPFLLLFGTGWGLAPEILDGADAVLPPILGPGSYNHLSVRSAAAIILDRLMGAASTGPDEHEN
ncbi:MAG: RNA methyltransferase [bacterium]|nr:RNA methyltransferase [bacterium]